jgi:hypothetical protein
LAWSANSANIEAAGQATIAFPEGCLMTGTFSTTGGEGKNSGGSIYTFDLSTLETAPVCMVEVGHLEHPIHCFS